MAKIVLVRARHREPLAKVGRDVTRDQNSGNLIEVPQMRQFHDYECYMRPEEAAFLIDSTENKKARAKGKPMYWYPAGVPVAVEEKPDSPLSPPLTVDQVATADPQQAAAAEEHLKDLQRIAESKGDYDEKVAEQQGQPPARGGRGRGKNQGD